jgi:hypothetical protein
MSRFIYSFFLSIFTLLQITGYGQQSGKFSSDSKVFHDQLNDLFSKINSKEDRKICEDMMTDFTHYWNTGYFTSEVKENIIKSCDLMQSRRLAAYPDFYHFLSANKLLVDMGHSNESYEAWTQSVFLLLNDRRSTKSIRDFMGSSYNLLKNNILYSSRSVTWKASSHEFYFLLDSIPSVFFEETDLICLAYQDSSVIYQTGGSFYPVENKWVGSKGLVDWSRAGFDPNAVFAELEDYQVVLSFSRYTVDSVRFYKKDYWDRPLLGDLEEKILANVDEESATYPHFKSYLSQVEIKSLFKDVDYIGGIEVRGRKFIGIGVGHENAMLTFNKDNKVFVRVLSDNFTIYPDRIASAYAKASIYQEEDSIFHPGLKLSFVALNRELGMIRAAEGTSKSPFYDSYHHLDIFSEAIYWRMDEPVLHFQSVKGSMGASQGIFESGNFFSRPRYLRLQGIDLINPLDAVERYAQKYNVSEVSVQGLAEDLLLPQSQIIAMLVTLSNWGFLIYDRETKMARIKDKLYDYIKANNRKIDYDVIQFASETRVGPNASLELDSFGLRLYGVPFVALSDSQNVIIYPQNQQLIIKKGMDFTFTGRVRAGTFDFHARNVDFNYDQFRLDMPVIDSMSFYVRSFETDERGERPYKKVQNVVSDLGGFLFIDDPMNKSGLKDFPAYPIFTSTKDAYVYYDSRSIFNGVYKRDNFFFYLYPFTIDSLDNFKTEQLQFEGYLASAGIFPDIEEKLRVQQDYSLGFKTKTPEFGLPAYGAKGFYYSDIALSNDGLRGDGWLKYLASTSWSNDFRFFPDSSNTIASRFIIEEQFTPLEYPDVSANYVHQQWFPYDDLMVISHLEQPIEMFSNQSQLKGKLYLTPEKLLGSGLMALEDAEMHSKKYSFGHHEIFADSADFNLKSAEHMLSAFATRNYKSHIDFFQRKGEFVSNGGASFVEFPIIRYLCLIDEFDWYMDAFEIAIGRIETEVEMSKYNNLTIRELIDVPLKGSEFISTHPEQDSLRFISTTAIYNLKEHSLQAEDVKYILVADATIFPANRKVVIEPGAKMRTIGDAQVLANSVTRFHEIYDAVIDIKGQKSYNGIGNYDYVDAIGGRQQVFLKQLGVDPTYQTVGVGNVSDTLGFKLSDEFYFTGEVTLAANNEFLSFDGGFKIKDRCSRDMPEWVKFASEVNPKDMYLNIEEELMTIKNKSIMSSVMFSVENNQFYSGFLAKRESPLDQRIITANGFIHYDKPSDKYQIGSLEKLKGLTIEGNELALNMNQCILTGEGVVNFGADLGRVKVESFGEVNYYMIPDSINFDLVLFIDFPFDDKLLELMAAELEPKNLPAVNITRHRFNKALTDLLGSEPAERLLSEVGVYGRFRRYPAELQKTILVSEVKMRWNPATRSFISYGPIGIGSIGKTQLHKFTEGYIEIDRKRTGDEISIYIEFDKGKGWYFFNCRNNLMQTISSNTDYNNYIRELKDDKRRVKADKKGEEDYSYIISNLRKKTDFLRRIQGQ